jgi:hypothetical protein
MKHLPALDLEATASTPRRGRCPDIHQTANERNTPKAEQGLQDDASKKDTT